MKGTRIPTHHSRLHTGAAETKEAGFSLVELLIAIFILDFGLLAAAQMIYVAMCSASLARSKGVIAVVANDKLESLSDLYAGNPGAPELTLGVHGPDLVSIMNPASGTTLNRFRITWQVSTVADPRAGKSLAARQVIVTVRPIDAFNNTNDKAWLNKSAVVAGIFSRRNP